MLLPKVEVVAQMRTGEVTVTDYRIQADTHITSYLLGSRFACVLKSFLFLDSFLVSLLACGSDGEGLLRPSGSIFGGSPLKHTCIC